MNKGHNFCRKISRMIFAKTENMNMSEQLVLEAALSLYDAGILSINYSLNEGNYILQLVL